MGKSKSAKASGPTGTKGNGKEGNQSKNRNERAELRGDNSKRKRD